MKQSYLLTKTLHTISAQEPSINAQLLERAGFISKLFSGVYTFLPLGLKVLNKIENIVRQEMNNIAGQEILMPSLQPKQIWEVTGRWDTVDILFKLKGAGDRDLCLGPTHEEVVTPLLIPYIKSYKDLPKYVYQIQTKFRNEVRAKSGILRGREFRMKDLYSFHTSQEDLDSYYNIVQEAYFKIFSRCGLGNITYLTYASGGIFSKFSHEFQAVTEFGEDIIFICSNCSNAVNKEIIDLYPNCPVCQTKNYEPKKAIEVGNIFKLGNRFSKSCGLFYTDKSGIQQDIMMGCYGIGTSRLMGAVVEASHDQNGIIWPKEISPYQVHLISLFYKEDQMQQANELYNLLIDNGIEVLFDDRPNVTPGEKFKDSDLLGIPLRLIISSKTQAMKVVEFKERNQKEPVQIPYGSVISEISRFLKS